MDTSEIIGSGMDGKNTYSMTNDDVRSYNFKGKYKSYPVFIENVSNDTLSIGFGNRIYPIVEANDSLGNWRPIQKPGTYYCGTGLQSFYLEPNNILISSCKLYDGDFYTKLRLVLITNTGMIKSNEFEGTINYPQFN